MISDSVRPAKIRERENIFAGRIWDVRRDNLTLESGSEVTRDYVVHPGAVGIIAVNSQGEMLLVEQYRHPMGKLMWEPPAGLLDEPDENPLTAAQRELLEETGFVAEQWNVLFDMATSPGGSTEVIRCYLAQQVSEHSEGRPSREDEEADMQVRWVPITEILEALHLGLVTSPILLTGTLAALLAMADPEVFLREAHAMWPSRVDLIENDRVRS